MAIRFSDMNMDKSGANDFVIRQRTPTVLQIILIFIGTLVAGISIIASVENKLHLILSVFILLIATGWYVILQLLRSRDMLLATEFQNALFASAMGLHNKFTIIIKRDGSIIYLDRSFQTLFPDFINQPYRSIDMLIKAGKVSKDESDKIFKAIDSGVYGKVLFSMEDAKGASHNLVLSVEPILRPAGFTMLRGREYIEQRQSGAHSNITVLNSEVTKTSTTLFSHVIDSMNIGVYITSPTGDVVYTNGLLDQWLGYSEGEISSRNLNLQNLAPAKRNAHFAVPPIDFEGPVQLERKDGIFVKAFINQKIIRNEADLAMGCTAIVNLLADKSDAQKPEVW